MKKLFITLSFTIVSFLLFPQIGKVPPFINYQAILRDANGEVLTSSGTLRFKLYDSLTTSNPTYVEDHFFTPNSVGMINKAMGTGTVVSGSYSLLAWSSGKVSYEVFLNGSTTSIAPIQQFASVPYAIYALNSGNSGSGIASGSLNQTLYWDGSKWRPTFNLSNDGNNVGIGASPSVGKNKLLVLSTDPNDSAAFTSVRLSAGSRDAAVRGISSGQAANVSSITSSPFSNIYGGDFVANNTGNGKAIGVSGIGSSTLGLAIGVSGIGVGPTNSSVVGVYASVSTSSTNPNAYAAVFDQGKVSFKDDVIFNKNLYFPAPATTATPGAVMILDSQNKGVWTNNAGFNLWSKTTLTAVELANPNDNVGIGAPNPTEKLQIQSGGNTDVSIISPSTNISSLNFGTPVNHNSGRIAYNASGHSLNFSTNSTPNRIFINGTGNVGIGTGSPRNTLSVAGSVAVSKVSVSNNYTATTSDYIIEASAFVTITLVNSAMVDEGTLMVIRNRSGGSITVGAVGGDQIQRLGGTNVINATLTSHQVLRLYKSGAYWVEM